VRLKTINKDYNINMNPSLHTYLFSTKKHLKPPHTTTFPKYAKKRKTPSQALTIVKYKEKGEE